MDAESLKRITGKSISDFRRDLLAFGNQIITQTQKRIVRQSQAPLVKTTSAVLQRTGFRNEPLIKQTTPDNGNCCLKLKSSRDLLVKFAGITPCTSVVDFTGINGDQVLAKDPYGEFCFWGGFGNIVGTATYEIVPGDFGSRETKPIYALALCEDYKLSVSLYYLVSTIAINIFDSGYVASLDGSNTLITCPIENRIHFVGGTYVVDQ